MDHWAVTASINGKRMAIAVSADFGDASDIARCYAVRGWRTVKLRRLATADQFEEALFDLEKIHDWLTDS